MSVTNAALNRQQRKSLRMHERILTATINSLSQHGYAATSISEVLVAAGISRGTLQHHFPKKEDLITAAAERLMQRSLSILSEPEQRTRRQLASELLEMWTRLINTKEYRALLEILNAVRTDKTLRKRILPTLQNWNEAIDRQMLLSYRAKSGNDQDLVELMTMSRCMLRGLLIQKSFTPDADALASMLEHWIALISPHILPRKQHKEIT